MIRWALSWLPLPLVAAWGWLLGWVWWLLMPVRRAVAEEGFRLAFPGVDPGPPLRAMVAELPLVYAELCRHRRAPLEITWSGLEPVLERVRAGQGTLALSGHNLAWDLMLVAVGQQVPVSITVKEPAWGPAARWIRELRAGVELLPPTGSMERVYGALAAGRVAILIQDQRYNKGIPVPFFGRPAWTSPAAAVAAAKAGVPVYGIWSERLGLGRHRLTWEELPFVGDVEVDTAAASAWYEAKIRQQPHRWLWLHDRWKVPR